MNKSIYILLLLLVFSASLFGDAKIGWREDFTGNGIKLPKGWEFQGGKFFVTKTEFRINNNSLTVKADCATGTLMTKPKVDLKKYPIMRWRWRVMNLPPKADGRTKYDDQAIVVYIGFGGALSSKTLAYRWETETPKSYWGETTYGGGVVKVVYTCLRNKSDKLEFWYDQEVNVYKDLMARFGEVPKSGDFVISIGGNSQYTESSTIAELDYIEFVAK